MTHKIRVEAIAIHRIRGFAIHIYHRDSTGSHGNDYVKVSRRGVKGKYILNIGWESEPDLGNAKAEITTWIDSNIDFIRKKIGELK
jgi:hypothetical protein